MDLAVGHITRCWPPRRWPPDQLPPQGFPLQRPRVRAVRKTWRPASPNLTVVLMPDPLCRLDAVAVVSPGLQVACVVAQGKERCLHDQGQVTEDISALLVLKAPVRSVKHEVALLAA